MPVFDVPKPKPTPAMDPASPADIRVQNPSGSNWTLADLSTLAAVNSNAVIDASDGTWMVVPSTVGDSPALAKLIAHAFPGTPVHWSGVTADVQL